MAKQFDKLNPHAKKPEPPVYSKEDMAALVSSIALDMSIVSNRLVMQEIDFFLLADLVIRRKEMNMEAGCLFEHVYKIRRSVMKAISRFNTERITKKLVSSVRAELSALDVSSVFVDAVLEPYVIASKASALEPTNCPDENLEDSPGTQMWP